MSVSKASVAAWASLLFGGGAASTMTVVRPADSRAKPMCSDPSCAGPDAGCGKRKIKLPVQSPVAAMQSRQSAIRMAKRAQAGRDCADGRQDRLWRGAVGLGQRLRAAQEQREEIKEFLGVARGNLSVRADGAAAGLGQWAKRQRQVKVGQEQGGAELRHIRRQPRGAIGCGVRAPREEPRLPGEDKGEGSRIDGRVSERLPWSIWRSMRRAAVSGVHS